METKRHALRAGDPHKHTGSDPAVGWSSDHRLLFDSAADFGARELSLLTSVERPVVLVSIRTDSPLTGEVAAGNRLVGLHLPYSPLHLLLLQESGRPLVSFPAGVPDTSPRMTA